jgi:hypothetical protein
MISEDSSLVAIRWSDQEQPISISCIHTRLGKTGFWCMSLDCAKKLLSELNAATLKCRSILGVKKTSPNIMQFNIEIPEGRSTICYRYGCNHWYLCIKHVPGKLGDFTMQQCPGYSAEDDYSEYHAD